MMTLDFIYIKVLEDLGGKVGAVVAVDVGAEVDVMAVAVGVEAALIA